MKEETDWIRVNIFTYLVIFDYLLNFLDNTK